MILSALLLLGMTASVLVIPLGLPGMWLLAVFLISGVLFAKVPWTLALVGAGVVAAVETAEFVILKRLGARYGASRKAFAGAIAGGFLGLFWGIPIPIVGPVLTAFLGTLVGAGLVTFLETRSLRSTVRVGWGVLLARTLSVGLKVGAGFALIVLTASILLFR